MIKCKKNIFLIFGYLLIVAILFVPHTSWRVSKKAVSSLHQGQGEGLDKYTVKTTAVYKDSSFKTGFMFTPLLLYKNIASKIEMSKHEFATVTKYKVRLNLLITELTIIIFIGGFAYILSCVVLRKSPKPTPSRKE